MNQIATIQPTGEPAIGSGLDDHLRQWVSPDPCYHPRVLPHHVEEARRVLPGFQDRLRPASLDEVRIWLAPINASVCNPQPQDELLDLIVPTIAALCSDLPGAVFNDQTRHEAMKRFKFWPAGAEIYELLSPHAALIRKRAAAIESISKHVHVEREPEPQRGSPSSEASAYVRELVASYTNEARARESAQRSKGPSAKALYLNPLHLLRVYASERSEIVRVRELARERETFLRKQLGVPDGVCSLRWLSDLANGIREVERHAGD
jgi:hypothetical protein